MGKEEPVEDPAAEDTKKEEKPDTPTDLLDERSPEGHLLYSG